MLKLIPRQNLQKLNSRRFSSFKDPMANMTEKEKEEARTAVKNTSEGVYRFGYAIVGGMMALTVR